MQVRILFGEHRLDMPADFIVHPHVHVNADRRRADQGGADDQLEAVPARVDEMSDDGWPSLA
jgi:hypothetical protein